MFANRKNPDVRRLDIAFRPGPTSALYLVRNTLLDAILKYRKKLTGRMMDFGCGQSPYRPLFDHVDYTGVDIHVSGFPDGDKRADHYFDGEKTPFSENHFDSILCTEVLEHAFEPAAMLNELHRVLKPGGRLLLTCPFMWELHEEPWDYARYTPYAVRSLLKESGFEVVEEERAGHPAEAIAQQQILYFTSCTVRKLPPGVNFIAWHMMVTLRNLGARMLSRLLPRYGRIYLSNVFLAQKPQAEDRREG